MSSLPLKKLALRGAAWTFIGYGFSQSLRFGSNLILTRLLVPELFGLMALVNVFITGLALFSDIGINPSIIQNKRGDDPTFLNTAWTLQVIRGFGLWLCCLILALPVSQLYSEPKLLWLLPAVGLTTIISGFNSTSLATLNRHLAIGKLTILQLGVQVISLTTMIIWAYFQQSIWAIVIGILLSSFVQAVVSHWLNPLQPNRFAWNKTAFKEIFSFGRWIFLSTLLSFLANQSDRLIIGKLLSIEILGVYTIAYTLADVPRQVSNKLGNNVLFPVISRNKTLPRKELRAAILKKRKFALLVVSVLLAILISFGDFIILALYDERYAQASWMLPLLAMGLWHTILYNTMGPTLIGIGKPIYRTIGTMLTLLMIVVGLPFAFSHLGIFGIVLVVAFSDFPKYIVMMYGLWHEKLNCLGEDFQVTILFIIFTLSLLGCRYLLGLGLPIFQTI